ncbi:MAG: hypothetical protein ACJA2G_002112 [Cognaticolwellia sp.]
MKLSYLERLKLKLSTKKRLLVIGDSHTAVFNCQEFKHAVSDKYNSFVVTVGGATVSGLSNPNSQTNSKQIFDEYLQFLQPDVVVILLGEVDVGFLLWHQSQKYQKNIDELLGFCLTKYDDFLASHTGKTSTIVVSVPLPTIKDDQDWGEIANARKSIKATQRQRTDLTLSFNQQLKQLCNSRSLFYMDLDAESLGPDNLVTSNLLSKDNNNHHYDNSQYLPLILKYLKPLL